MKLRALRGKIIATEIEKGQQVSRGGIVLLDDDGKDQGIRPRWMKVFSVGEEVAEIKEGNWIYVEHGRWTRGMTLRDDNNKELTLWGIDPEAVLLITDDKPEIERILKDF